MNNVNKCKMLLSSLSVFRGIMNRSVPNAFYELLLSLDKKPEEFLGAYGKLCSMLCERGCADKFAFAISETALFDDNCFARAATAGRQGELPENVVSAVKTDCDAILTAAKLTSDEVLEAYTYADEIKELIPILPKWQTGKCAPCFDGFDGSLDKLSAYYKENGCGMFARYKAFIWRDGDIQPVEHPDKIDMDTFTGYERQRSQVVNNTLSFIQGKSCNNCLLYGDKGTGKSSTVKAIANEFRKDGLRIVEMPKDRLIDFPLLVDKIAALPLKFIIFIDDLSFQHQDQSYTTLKAVLEGGLAARPDNALIYATSNRRHLVKESISDRTHTVDDINVRDNMQESLSLSDRFGLAVCYTIPSKNDFLEIVYSLAEQRGVKMTHEELALGAEQFALSRGGRSPRCARQYVESLFC